MFSFPLNLDNFIFSDNWQSGKKRQIMSRLAADFTGWDKDNMKFETELKKVLKSLRADEYARETPPKSKL